MYALHKHCKKHSTRTTTQHMHCTRTAQVLLLLAAPGGYLQRATAAAGRPELLTRFLLLLLDQPRRRGAQMPISGASGAQMPISGDQMPISGASGAEASVSGASDLVAASGVAACLRRVAMQPEEQAGRPCIHMHMHICGSGIHAGAGACPAYKSAIRTFPFAQAERARCGHAFLDSSHLAAAEQRLLRLTSRAYARN